MMMSLILLLSRKSSFQKKNWPCFLFPVWCVCTYLCDRKCAYVVCMGLCCMYRRLQCSIPKHLIVGRCDFHSFHPPPSWFFFSFLQWDMYFCNGEKIIEFWKEIHWNDHLWMNFCWNDNLFLAFQMDTCWIQRAMPLLEQISEIHLNSKRS